MAKIVAAAEVGPGDRVRPKGGNFTLSNPTPGVYDINFNPALPATPVVVASVSASGARAGEIRLGNIDQNGFLAFTNSYDNNAVRNDVAFTFVAILPD